MTKPEVSPSEVGVHAVLTNRWVCHSMAASFFGSNGHTFDLALYAAKVPMGHVGNKGRHDDVNDAFFSLQAVSLRVQMKLNENYISSNTSLQ